MSADIYLAYLIACIVLVIIPGPSVTLIIANSMTHGVRAGLLNVAGTQIGIGIIIALVGLGLASLIETMGVWFTLVRLAGAAYLIWLGWRLLRARGTIDAPGRVPAPRGGFFLQGFLVSVTNPKSLVFFGAFIPQFIDPARDYTTQIALMGATALAVAAVSDGIYALAFGKAGRKISPIAVRWMSRVSGGVLIGGGVWLAMSRSR